MNTTPPPDPTPEDLPLPELRRKAQEFANAEALRQIRNLTHERMADERMKAFPERIDMPELSFSKTRQCRKDEVGAEAHKHFQEAMEKFSNETLPPFRDSMRGLFQQIETTWNQLKPSVELLAKIEREMDGKPFHPKDMRDERGVKHPSTVPPFWAARPNGRRR